MTRSDKASIQNWPGVALVASYSTMLEYPVFNQHSDPIYSTRMNSHHTVIIIRNVHWFWFAANLETLLFCYYIWEIFRL